jgi:hypothetical protein
MPTYAVIWMDPRESWPYRMHRFFADVARVLDGVDAILLVGPWSASRPRIIQPTRR